MSGGNSGSDSTSSFEQSPEIYSGLAGKLSFKILTSNRTSVRSVARNHPRHFPGSEYLVRHWTTFVSASVGRRVIFYPGRVRPGVKAPDGACKIYCSTAPIKTCQTYGGHLPDAGSDASHAPLNINQLLENIARFSIFGP